MILGEPRPTQYDLTFSMLGFPIRVHPAFFLVPLLMGSSFTAYASHPDLNLNAGVILVIVAVVFFLSILVHEMGHALAFRY